MRLSVVMATHFAIHLLPNLKVSMHFDFDTTKTNFLNKFEELGCSRKGTS